MNKTSNILLSFRTKTDLEKYATSPDHAVLLSGANSYDANNALQFLVHQINTEHGLKDSDVLSLDGATAGVAEVRDIRSLISQKQTNGIAKVVSITDLDSLNGESQNTMLKMLEEPVSGVVYVLSTKDIGAVIRTVVSRSTVLNIHSVVKSDIQDAYPHKTSTEIDLAIGVARSDTQKLVAYLEGENEGLDLAKEILASDKLARLAKADELSKQRDRAIEVVSYMQNIFLYMLEKKISNEESDISRQVAAVKAAGRAMQILEANGNVKLTLDALFVTV